MGVPMTVGSLFSGIGGFDLGLERAGMDIRWQVERDPWCQKILAKHWPDVPRYGDVTTLTGDELEPVDLICGGFPCQPVSLAGQQKGTDDDRWLWPAIQMWPTPTTMDWKDTGENMNWEKRAAKSRLTGAVNVAVQRWPTPTAGDATGSGNRNSGHSKAHAGISLTDAALTGDSSTPRSAVTGSLNPNWVEWLQGFSVGWTDLEDSATPSCPSAPSGSDAGSSPSTESPHAD